MGEVGSPGMARLVVSADLDLLNLLLKQWGGPTGEGGAGGTVLRMRLQS